MRPLLHALILCSLVLSTASCGGGEQRGPESADEAEPASTDTALPMLICPRRTI